MGLAGIGPKRSTLIGWRDFDVDGEQRRNIFVDVDSSVVCGGARVERRRTTAAPPPKLLPAMSASALPLIGASSLKLSFRRFGFRGALFASGFASFPKKCGLCQENVSLVRRDRVGKVRCSLPKVQGEIDFETCELVSGTELVIGEGKDSIHAYLMKAVKNNNGNGVLLLSDELGFEDSSIREFAYRVACSGYNVLVPDLFRGNPWKVGWPREDFGPWSAAHLQDRVSSDIARSAQWLEDEFIAAGICKKLGIIGFSFGADRLIETLAEDTTGRFGTGVCFYGSQRGLGLTQKIRVPLLFICGDADPLCPVSVVRDMEAAVAGAKAVVYHGRGQGFAHRPASQDEDDDAEEAFTITRAWLHEFLSVD
ncbi:alpha/beta-Hydrolases superfamily protein [Wolffia australiana]